jgi:hypothetical protein
MEGEGERQKPLSACMKPSPGSGFALPILSRNPSPPSLETGRKELTPRPRQREREEPVASAMGG